MSELLGLWLVADLAGNPLDETLVERFDPGPSPAGRDVMDERIVPGAHVWNVCHRVFDSGQAVADSPGGSVRVIFHGEVHNGPDLARKMGLNPAVDGAMVNGPTLVARGIEENGISFIDNVCGSYVLLARCAQQQKLYLANDRYGLRPHYWTRDGDLLLFAPAVRDIYRVWSRKTRLDPQGVAEFFALEHLREHRTLIQDIEVLPGSSVMEIGPSLARNTYWDFTFPEQPLSAPHDELARELARLLRQGVERKLSSDAPVGATLSGGLDSRMVAAIMRSHFDPLPTFTYGHPDCEDRRFARTVADRLGIVQYCADPCGAPWKENFLKSAELGNGMVSIAHTHLLLLFPLLKAHVATLMTGTIGGQLIGANVADWMLGKRAGPAHDRYFFDRRNSAFTIEEMTSLFREPALVDAAKNLFDTYTQAARQSTSDILANYADYDDFRQRQRRFVCTANAVNRTCVEIRTPFYDYDLVDFVLTLPASARAGRRIYRDALRLIMPELLDIPNTGSTRPLSEPDDPIQDRPIRHRVGRATTRLRRAVPPGIKSVVRRLRKPPPPPTTPAFVDYVRVFSQVVVPELDSHSDRALGLTPLTDQDMISGIAGSLAPGKNVAKLGVWTTFQMYRAQDGLDSI